ncbi:MAG: ArsB/NhaD family transporter, partial [Terracidiphilus sp.]
LAAAVVGVGNNLVNNLPLGLIAGSTLRLIDAHGLIAHSVLIAVDIGPNLSVTGSLATILWLIALRREGVHVSFLSFLKVGAVAMPLALAAAIAGAVILR